MTLCSTSYRLLSFEASTSTKFVHRCWCSGEWWMERNSRLLWVRGHNGVTFIIHTPCNYTHGHGHVYTRNDLIGFHECIYYMLIRRRKRKARCEQYRAACWRSIFMCISSSIIIITKTKKNSKLQFLLFLSAIRVCTHGITIFWRNNTILIWIYICLISWRLLL